MNVNAMLKISANVSLTEYVWAGGARGVAWDVWDLRDDEWCMGRGNLDVKNFFLR